MHIQVLITIDFGLQNKNYAKSLLKALGKSVISKIIFVELSCLQTRYILSLSFIVYWNNIGYIIGRILCKYEKSFPFVIKKKKKKHWISFHFLSIFSLTYMLFFCPCSFFICTEMINFQQVKQITNNYFISFHFGTGKKTRCWYEPAVGARIRRCYS